MKVYIYFANEADVAVVIARYKSAKGFYKMFLWHTDTDKVDPGQWITHKKIWPKLCRISEDGTRFQYFMAELNPWKTFTIMCEPPYFSALKFKEECGTWFCEGQENWVDSPTKGPDMEFENGSTFTRNDKTIKFQDNVLLVNSIPLIQFNDYSFENIAPPAVYPINKI
jgi:hypothetical protein